MFRESLYRVTEFLSMGLGNVLLLYLAVSFACCDGILTSVCPGRVRLACPGLNFLSEVEDRGGGLGRIRVHTRAAGSDLLLAASGLTRLRGGCTDASRTETELPGEADISEGDGDDGTAKVPSEGGEQQDQARPVDAKMEAPREPEVEKTEGLAKFHFRKGEVFYNKAQVVNRDLSVLVISAFIEARQREVQEERERRMRNREAAAAAAEVIGEPDPTNGSVREGDSGETAAGGGTSTMLDQDQPAAQRQGHADAASTLGDPPSGKEEGSAGGGGDEPAKPRGVRILDALSATGLRAIRYTLEVGRRAHLPSLPPSFSLPLSTSTCKSFIPCSNPPPRNFPHSCHVLPSSPPSLAPFLPLCLIILACCLLRHALAKQCFIFHHVRAETRLFRSLA